MRFLFALLGVWGTNFPQQGGGARFHHIPISRKNFFLSFMPLPGYPSALAGCSGYYTRILFEGALAERSAHRRRTLCPLRPGRRWEWDTFCSRHWSSRPWLPPRCLSCQSWLESLGRSGSAQSARPGTVRIALTGQVLGLLNLQKSFVDFPFWNEFFGNIITET